MNEIEQLRRKLVEIERENVQLRMALNRKTHNNPLPSEIVSKYPLLNSMYNVRASSEPWTSILRAIRWILFPDAKKRVSVRYGDDRERNIRCQDMSESQYSLYSETLDAVLSVLSEGREKRLKMNDKEESACPSVSG